MDFKDSIRDVAKRSRVAQDTAQTEEATKSSVVMPFIRALGFDVFDLSQVEPEFTADVGLKKGEKVDFALKIDGSVVMLVEAKPISMDLGKAQYSQLYRYFGTETGAKIGILTNGLKFWFFTDIDAPNKMDKRPFFSFDLESFDDDDITELSKFQRNVFDVSEITKTASQLKYTNAAAVYIESLISSPDEDFIRLIGKQIYDGNLTKQAVESLANPISAAFRKVIRDQIQERLNVALSEPSTSSAVAPAPASPPPVDQGTSSEIETTEEEIAAYRIIQAIASEIAAPERITLRDSKSYCAILFDDNNRKPVCRLYFNAKSIKYISIFDENKQESKININQITDIFQNKTEILKVVQSYL